MCCLETRGAVLDVQKTANSLLNSLLAGNWGGERLAPDCLIRHAVWDAEKLGSIFLKTAGNPRNSPTLGLKPDRRKCPSELGRHALPPFSLQGTCAVRFQQLRRAAEYGGETGLDTYGAQNPAEFFAVATESFFEKPGQLKERHPELYAELKEFYHQDPLLYAPARPE